MGSAVKVAQDIDAREAEERTKRLTAMKFWEEEAGLEY